MLQSMLTVLQICRERNSKGPAVHNFLVQGTDRIFLAYQPSFHLAKYRRQLILSAEFGQEDMEIYRTVKKTSSRDAIILRTVKEIQLEEVLDKVNAGEIVEIQGTVYNSK